jgi:hypothetical protein
MRTLDIPDVKVFTDSLGIEGMIQAAAVLYRTGRLKTKIRYKHGPQRHRTVYEGEGKRIVLGARPISNE